MPLTTTESTSALGKRHICPEAGCSASFSRPNRLAIHLRSHTGERPFHCSQPNCDKRYARNQHLRRHILNAHQRHTSPRTAVACPQPQCGKLLGSRDALAKHLRSHRRREHRCADCHMAFRKRRQLVTHSYKHTGVPPWPCRCCSGRCQRRFLTPSRRLAHEQRHQRRHVCPQCRLQLPAWRALVEHRRRQHGCSADGAHAGGGFSCDRCSAVLLSRSSLRAHRTVHDERRPVFACPLNNCARYYYHQRNLSQHVRSAHQGVGYACPVTTCRKTFTTRHRWQSHMRLHGASGATGGVAVSRRTPPPLTRVGAAEPAPPPAAASPAAAAVGTTTAAGSNSPALANCVATADKENRTHASATCARVRQSVFSSLTGQPDPQTRLLSADDERRVRQQTASVARLVVPALRPLLPVRLSPAR